MQNPVRPLSFDMLKHVLAPRERSTHKGDYGHVVVVGGDLGFGGAALMAAEAAARCGAGLTTVATRTEHTSAFVQRRPELMVKGVNHASDLETVLTRASVLVVGPGLGQSDWSFECLQTSLQYAAQNALPVVLDADALNWLSKDKSLSEYNTHGKWTLTPHAGEAARLLALERTEVDADRVACVSTLHRQYGGAVILKGPGTLIAYTQAGRTQIAACTHGNPGMASGGMGDVLSGVLGSLQAQGFSLADSVCLGVCIHSKAADLAAEADGERGLLATDLLPYIRRLMNP